MKNNKTDKVNFRSIVIEDVVKIEREISKLLKLILRIHIPDSKTLGNRNSSLSFISKIHLLNDLGNLSSENVKLFKSLAEIRNQFAHNIDCDSFEEFAKINDQTWKFLTKIYTDCSFYGVYRKLYVSCSNILSKVHDDQLSSLLFETEKIILCDIAINVDKIVESLIIDDDLWNKYLDITYTQIHELEKRRLIMNLFSSLISLKIIERRDKIGIALISLPLEKRLELLSNGITKDTLLEYKQYLNEKFKNKLDHLDYGIYEELDLLEEEEWGIIGDIRNYHDKSYEKLLESYSPEEE